MAISNKLGVGALVVVLGVALGTACSSSSKKSNAGGGAGGAGASGGAAGSGGVGAGGASGSDGGILDAQNPFADVDLDAPYQLPDGGCGQIFCPNAVHANCPNFAQTLSDCATFCNDVDQSPCKKEWDAFLTCAGPSPNVTCDSSTGLFTVKGCETEFMAFYKCESPDAGL